MTKAIAKALLFAAPKLGLLVRTLPGALGACAVTYGVWEIYEPAAFIVAGTFMLAIDRTL